MYKYLIVKKGGMLLPKEALVALLKKWHNEFYDVMGVPQGEEFRDDYNRGIAEGFKRMTLFIESIEHEEFPGETT